MIVTKLYILFLGISFLIFLLLMNLNHYRKKNENLGSIKLKELTLLIPFRNEEENLPPIFNSLNKQIELPFEIIFIDDHSEDDSAEMVKTFCREHAAARLLSLPEISTGKKQALEYGVNSSNGRFILTMDADVTFKENYFLSLSGLPVADLWILPVVMKESKTSWLYHFEHLFFNAFNFLLSPVYPLSASGANLLFDKTKVDYQVQNQEHSNIASGDDYFLLKHIRDNGGDIFISNQAELLVETDSPASFKEYLSQRTRWISKAKHRMTVKELILSLYVASYHLIMGWLLFFLVFENSLQLLIFILILRLSLDMILLAYYQKGLNQKVNLIRTILFIPIYPFLFLTVFFFSLKGKPIWKGREV